MRRIIANGPTLLLAGALGAALTYIAMRPAPFLPAASAQFPAVAGGGGVYLMPGQLATNAWGVYLLDTDRGTMMVYRYDAGGNRLQFLAARDVGADRSITDFNTFPPPAEIERLVELEREARQERQRRRGMPVPDELDGE
jgi:hypothetical protein